MKNFSELELGLLIGCIALAVVVVILIAVLATKTNRLNGAKKASKIKIKDGVRYSTDSVIENGSSIHITHNVGDIILEKGVAYVANKIGILLPGQYTVLAAARGEDKFNIRLGGFVREYAHGDSVVIPEGGEITCTSHSVVLR